MASKERYSGATVVQQSDAPKPYAGMDPPGPSLPTQSARRLVCELTPWCNTADYGICNKMCVCVCVNSKLLTVTPFHCISKYLSFIS